MQFLRWILEAKNRPETAGSSLFFTILFCLVVGIAGYYNFYALLPGTSVNSSIIVKNLDALTRPFAQVIEFAFQELVFLKGQFESGQEALQTGDFGNIILEELPTDVFRVATVNGLFVGVYILFTFFLHFFRNNEERHKWADSVYFLGFILTLMSLVLALGNADRLEGADISLVVVQNAIALSSTVFAIFGRQALVLLIPVIEEKDDMEEQFVTYELLQSRVNELSSKFYELTNHVDTLGVTVQTTRTVVDAAGKLFEDEVSNAAKALTNKSKEISEIELDQDHISNQIASAAKLALEKLDTEISDLGASLKSGAESIVARVSAVSDIVDELGTVFSDAGKKNKTALTVLAEEFDVGALKSQKALDGLTGAIAEVAEPVRQSTQTLSGVIADGSVTVQQGIQALSDGIKNDALDLFKTRISETLDTVSAHLAEEMTRLDGTFESFRSSVYSLTDTVGTHAKQIEALSEQADGYRKDLELNQDVLRSLTTSLTNLETSVRNTVFDPKWLEQHGARLENLDLSMKSLETSFQDATSRLEDAYATLNEAHSNPKRSLWGWLFNWKKQSGDD